ncbi:winged helix-turn-helix domain-containing protein [Micromonospora mirobrigensis]|uniref:winged helix-turn-helix domain-containing protein n=1 Tax=Micromonospora mirobrigensis TaxID=262898 RepID=UPI00159F2EA4|nr:winged helix-turn-helix domain-containing protein [Micromonospora mirobrigensis]
MSTTDPRLRALAHPVRLRMLSLMWSAPLSAAALARELGISHALASQHLRRLDAAGLVELADVRPNRGGRERRYRSVRGPLLTDQREGQALLAEALARNLLDRVAERAPDTAGLTIDAELWVAPEQWAAARSRLHAIMTELHEAAQPPHAPGTVRVGATVLAFEMTDPPPPVED